MTFSSAKLMGTKKDFLKLTRKPLESEKDLNKHLRLKRFLASPGKMRRVSSAYYTIGKSPPKVSLRGCLRMPICQALLTTDCRRSAAKTNNRGESGSPCLTPLLHSNPFPRIPFSRTEEEPELKMFCIQFIHLEESPLYLRICNITSCSSLSKAFSNSTLRIMTFFFE